MPGLRYEPVPTVCSGRRTAPPTASLTNSRVNPRRVATTIRCGLLKSAPFPPSAIRMPAISQYDTVIWGPLDAPALPSPWPWSKSEMATLAKTGCRLPDPGDLLQQEAEAWLKPVLAARHQLILLLPPPDHEIHPVWQAIESLFESVPVTSVEDLLWELMQHSTSCR